MLSELGPFEKVAIVGATAAVIWQWPAISANMAATSELRQSVKADSAQVMEIQAKEIANAGLSEIAEKRYAGHCEAIVNLENPSIYTGIVENQPILSGSHAHLYAEGGPNHGQAIHPSHTLQPGVLACDAYGKTALIEKGPGGMPVAGSIAVTQNKEVVQGFINSNQGVIKRPTVAVH